MVKFSIYDATGRVLYGGEVPESMVPLQQGNVYLGEVDGRTHYIVNGAPVPRPVNPMVVEDTTLTQLPSPCTISINGAVYPCTDGRAVLNFTYPGTYRVRVECFPFADVELQLIK